MPAEPLEVVRHGGHHDAAHVDPGTPRSCLSVTGRHRERDDSGRVVLGGDVGGPVLAVAAPFAKVEGGNGAFGEQ